jgi:hypothetical protein
MDLNKDIVVKWMTKVFGQAIGVHGGGGHSAGLVGKGRRKRAAPNPTWLSKPALNGMTPAEYRRKHMGRKITW